ncbi:MAG: TIM barrel protein, partial [Bacteroidales bacterium]
MSIAGEPANALRLGHSIGCDTIQIFTRSPNRWAGMPLTEEQIATFHRTRSETGIDPVVAHSAYLINLATPKQELWTRSAEAAIKEVQRCALLGVSDYIIHPGAHTGSGEMAGLSRIAQGLDAVCQATPDTEVRILLETTSGAGTHLGYRFEHLAWLIEHVRVADRLGV